MKAPKVTVLMSVYNGQKFLKDAIGSILQQDFTDFEFLIINDGSKDDSENIIRSFSDPRIRLVNNEVNLGLIASLNKGIEYAQGEYIARMDCDDISLKNRLSVQVKFMDDHRNVSASGSRYYLLRNGKKAVADLPLGEEEIKCFMIFNSPIAHPTVIIRNSAIRENKLNYRAGFLHAEDYDLWSQLSEISSLANVPDVLLDYRVHENQITGNAAMADQRTATVSTIRKRHLEKIGVVPSETELLIHNLVSDGRKADNLEQLNRTEEWLKKILAANEKTGQLNKDSFRKIILERWIRMCFNFFGAGKGLRHYYRSSLKGAIKISFTMKLQLMLNLFNSYRRLRIK